MKDKKRKYDLSYFMQYGGSDSKGNDPMDPYSLNRKLGSKLGDSRMKKVSKKKGLKNGSKNKDSDNRSNFSLSGISKLQNVPSQGKSKEYLKAKSLAEVEAAKIAEQIEQQYMKGIKESAIKQKQKQKERIQRKRERFELEQLDQKSQETAGVFIQSVLSEEFSKDELMKNFCRLKDERIQDNIVVNVFVSKFIENLQKINNYLKESDKLELLKTSYYTFEAHYNKIFKIFYELQTNNIQNQVFREDLSHLIDDLGLDFNEFIELIKAINNNGFNYELAGNLKKWIETFKKYGSEKYKIDIADLQKGFSFEEIKSDIGIIIKNILERKELLGIKEDLITAFTKITGKISYLTHTDRIVSNIIQLQNIILSDGNIATFFEKYFMGYFSDEEVETVKQLVSKLADDLKNLKIKYDSEKESINNVKEKEENLLDEEFSKISNELEKPLIKLRDNLDRSNNAVTKRELFQSLIPNKQKEIKKILDEKKKEIDAKKKEIKDKFKKLEDQLNKIRESEHDKLFDDLKNSLEPLHHNATQRFNRDREILKHHLELIKDQTDEVQEGGEEKWNAIPTREEIRKIKKIKKKLLIEKIRKEKQQARLKSQAEEQARLKSQAEEQARLKSQAEEPAILKSQAKLIKKSIKINSGISKWNSTKPLSKKLIEMEEAKLKRNANKQKQDELKQIKELEKQATLQRKKEQSIKFAEELALSSKWTSNKSAAQKLKELEAQKLKELAEKELRQLAAKELRESEERRIKQVSIERTERPFRMLPRRRQTTDVRNLVLRNSRNHHQSFKMTYQNFFYPIEYLLNSYLEIISNYNRLFTDELKIKEELYFTMKIYNRLRSKDSENYSCTFGYLADKILKIDEIMLERNYSDYIDDYFIEAFRDFCKNTDFHDDSSVYMEPGRLFQTVNLLLSTNPEYLRIMSNAGLRRLTEGNSSALVGYSPDAAAARAANNRERKERETKRLQDEKQKQINSIQKLFNKIKSETDSNRDLNLDKLMEIKAMKNSLNKQLLFLNANSKQPISNYLTALDLDSKISQGKNKKRGLEIAEFLDYATNLRNSNNAKISEIKKTLDKLKEIKEKNNRFFNTETEKEIINELIDDLSIIYNSTTNDSDYPNRLQKYLEEKGNKLNNVSKLNNATKIEELLEKIKFLSKYSKSEKNKIMLKNNKKTLETKLSLMKIMEESKKFAALSAQPSEPKKSRVQKQTVNRGTEKEWFAKIKNIVYRSDDKKGDDDLDKKTIKKDDDIDFFIDNIAIPYWKAMTKTTKTPTAEELREIKLKIREKMIEVLKQKAPSSKKEVNKDEYFEGLIRARVFGDFLTITYNTKGAKADDTIFALHFK